MENSYAASGKSPLHAAPHLCDGSHINELFYEVIMCLSLTNMRWTASQNYFADRGRLDLLLQASGKDAILSVETYLELEYDLPCLIFEDVTVQRHPEDDWRMFSERTVYIMRDSLLSRFDQLCREYEATRGILPIENPFVSTLEEAVNRALRMNSYSYDYCLYDSLRDKKGPKLVLIVDDEFEAYYDIPDALFSILDICKDGIDHLETELARLKREAEENKRKVIAFPKKKNARRRKEAA